QDNGAALPSTVARCLDELVVTGSIHRVVQRGASARTQHANARGELLRIIREVLRDLRSRIEANHERLVAIRVNDLVQELDRSLLLKTKAIANRVAGVY